MTLVVALALDNHPLMIGDLLLSREAHSADSPIALPTGVDTFRGTARTIAGLSRKLVLIGTRCVLGWSCNDVRTAEEVVAGIRKLEFAGSLSLETIYTTIKSHPRADDDRLSIIGWIVEGDVGGTVTAHEIEYEALYGESAIFSEVRAIGSGARPFFELLKTFDKWQYAGTAPDEHWNKALWLTRVFHVIGTMFAAEHRQGNLARSLELSFGGGYELAIWESGKFVLVGGHTLSVWSASVTPEGVQISFPPPIIASVYYQGEFLTISSDRMVRESDSTISHQSYTFIVSPFADTTTSFKPVAPPRFEFHIHALDVRCDFNAIQSIGAMVEFSGPVAESRARLLDVAEGKKSFMMTPDFQSEMVNYIKMMAQS